MDGVYLEIECTNQEICVIIPPPFDSTASTYHCLTLLPAEASVLKALEQQLVEATPFVYNLGASNVGYRARNGHVVDLHIAGTYLAELPEAIGQLTSLETLFLDSNQLTALPESFGRLTSLQELSLHDSQSR